MIRFIFQTHEFDFNSGFERKDLKTIDLDIPSLEQVLKSGGRGEMGFYNTTLIGVEILDIKEDKQ